MANPRPLSRVISEYYYPPAVFQNPSNDITALLNSVGITCNLFLDCRKQSSLSLQAGFGTVNTWTDLSGGGLLAQQATQAKQPIIAPDGGIMFSGAGGQNLLIAANAKFNIAGSYTMIIIGRYVGAQTGTAYIGAIGDASTAFLGLNQNGASNQHAVKAGGVLVQATSTVSTTAPGNRVLCATLNGTTPVGIQVPNQAIVTTAIVTANASANEVLCLGGFNGVNGSAQCVIRAVLCFPSLISAANLAKIVTWAQIYHSVYTA